MSDAEQPYQVMPALEDDEYERLKRDIRNNGIEYPIIIDGDGEIIDGHHRKRAWEELGRDPDDLPTRVVDAAESENYHRAYRANLLRRDLTDGTKREVVKQYLLEHPDRVAEDTQREIASDLGVAQQTVSNAVQELRDGGKLTKVGELSTDEKREQVREYVENHPDASNREVARSVECDVTHVTVGKWRDEWDIQEPTTELDTFTNTRDEAEQALEVAEKATDATDEYIKETAQEEVEKISRGDTTPEEAADNVSAAENVVEKEQERTTRKEQFSQAVDESNAVTIDTGDFTDILDGIQSEYDHIITDPPYDLAAVQKWEKLAQTAERVLKPGGLLIAYSGKYHLPAVYAALEEHLEYFWQFIVTHSGGGARVWPRNLRTNYKPVIVYAKPPVEELDGLGHDVIDGDGIEKDSHEWQQAEGEAAELITQLTEPNDLICDPMCGSGTVGVAAVQELRRVHLIDRDSDAIADAARRVNNVL